MIAGIILLAGSVGLYAFNLITENRAQKNSAEILALFPETGTQEEDIGANDKYFYPFDINGKQYIASVEIPVLDLILPVQETWSYEKLKTSPCVYNMNLDKDCIVIAAHNYRKHFASIQMLQKGDLVILKNLDDVEYIYQVSKTEVLPSESVDDMLDDKWDLTLFTCDYRAVNRIAVRCINKETVS